MSDPLQPPWPYEGNESRISCLQNVLDYDGPITNAETAYRRALSINPLAELNFMAGSREPDELNFTRAWLPRLKPNAV